MTFVRFSVGAGGVVYVTNAHEAKAFSQTLRAAGETALASRVEHCVAGRTGLCLVVLRCGEGAESALAVLDYTEREPWRSATWTGLHCALREYVRDRHTARQPPERKPHPFEGGWR